MTTPAANDSPASPEAPKSAAPDGKPTGSKSRNSIKLSRDRLLRVWAIFIGLIVVQVGLLFAIESMMEFQEWVSHATARVTTGLLVLFGDGTVRLLPGNRIVADSFSLTVIFECTGLMNIVILIAAVCAFPSTWQAKLMGLSGGTAALLLINQVRLLSLFYLGQHLTKDQFENFHLVFWQSLMIFITLGIWFYWVSNFVASSDPEGKSAAATERRGDRDGEKA